jgi:hypothetical protein
MLNNIKQALGNQYKMFFHPGLPLSKFTPHLTLHESVKLLNHLLDKNGKDFSQHHDSFTQLMNANWIYQRLETEPIRKPILVHDEHGQLKVDCGDTRIMAVSAMKHPAMLSAIISVDCKQADNYSDWIPINDNQDLIQATNFDPQTVNVLFTLTEPGTDWPISWLEIGDNSTSHHLHDVDAKSAMMKNWINLQPDDFRFSIDWVTWPIDWSEYQDN